MRKFRYLLAAAFLLSLPFVFMPNAESLSNTSIIQKGIKENVAYTTGNDVFSSNLSFTQRNGFVRVTIAYSAASLVYFRLIGAATTNLPLNANANVAADSLYSFDIPSRANAGSQALTYNIRFNTNGTIRYLLVEEYSEAD